MLRGVDLAGSPAMGEPRKFRVRGTTVGAAKFEHELVADGPWHALARVSRLMERPEEVTSISAMPVVDEA